MAGKRVIAKCQLGGEFVTNRDGSLLYNGGEAYAVDVNEQTNLSNFSLKLQTCLIVARITFFSNLFIMSEEVAAGNMSILPIMPTSRSSRTTLSDHADPLINPVDVAIEMAIFIDQDADVGIFPLAFSVVDAEDGDNWHWFFAGTEICVDNIKVISSDAYNWVIQSEPEHWANAFFGRARIDSTQWMTKLTPSNEEKLKKEIAVAHLLQVLLTEGNIFEAHGEAVEVVDIDLSNCSCKGWQLTGLPCCHAIAVLECTGRNPYDYCSKYFTTKSYRITCAESIHPVPIVELPDQDESAQLTVIVTPPPTKQPPGWPKVKPTESIDTMKRQLQCIKCKGFGHNKKTCKES
ncbi:hypothetical protein SLA2020_523900 [Shorea laevis]